MTTSPTESPATSTAAPHTGPTPAVERELAAAEQLLAKHKPHIPHPHLARRATAGPVKTADHLPGRTAAARFNTKAALLITKAVGSMWCAYLFAAFDLISLPAAIRSGSAAIVAWVAQTFLQLVLLSVIMVGQNVQTAAGDARAQATFDDGEALLHYADGHAKSLAQLHAKLEQGLAHVHAKLDAIPTAAAAVPSASPRNQALDEHTAAELARQLGQHLDKLAQGSDTHTAVTPGTAPPAPAPAAPPVPPVPDPVAPPPAAPPAAPPATPADGTTGTGPTS